MKCKEEEKVADNLETNEKAMRSQWRARIEQEWRNSCYYVDENYPQYLAGFIRINTSGALITMETENYQIDGKKGNWAAADTVIIDGKQFYLMEHQEYGNQARGVILDAYGKQSLMNVNRDSNEETRQKIQWIYTTACSTKSCSSA